MKAPSKKNRRLISQMLATLLSFGLFIYFGFHLAHGDMGYFALRGLNQKLVETQEKHDRLAEERTVIENRVRLLRPGSLDLDMLDERARVVLGFVSPDERVILEK
jgi:cell division protein FtsB